MSDFITIYTDASYGRVPGKATIAFKAKCKLGELKGAKEIPSHNVVHAEMAAILYGIEESVKTYPELQGFFVNSDNLGCVRSFWTFKDYKCPAPAVEVKKIIHSLIGDRWIRAKHVKAHTGRRDTRSYMNRVVDKMTRMKV